MKDLRMILEEEEDVSALGSFLKSTLLMESKSVGSLSLVSDNARIPRRRKLVPRSRSNVESSSSSAFVDDESSTSGKDDPERSILLEQHSGPSPASRRRQRRHSENSYNGESRWASFNNSIAECAGLTRPLRKNSISDPMEALVAGEISNLCDHSALPPILPSRSTLPLDDDDEKGEAQGLPPKSFGSLPPLTKRSSRDVTI